MLNVTKLRDDIYKKLDTWDEKSQFTLAGVKNLSLSDMDTLLMYCELYEGNNPVKDEFIFSDDIKTVLAKYSE